MHFPDLSRSTRRLLLAGVLIGGLALFFVPDADSPLPSSSHQTRSSVRSVQLGPGIWMAPQSTREATPLWPDVSDTLPPSGPQVQPDGRIRIDTSLRDLLDHFLLGGHPGTRTEHLARLRHHLESSYSAVAFSQAWEIAERYRTYLDEHDRLLERESVPGVHMEDAEQVADANRIASWVAQRKRLRQTVLGVQVAQDWFGDEEQEMQLMLSALHRGQERLTAEPIGSDPLGEAAASLENLRAANAPLKRRRDEIAARFGEAAGQRYETFEREEMLWQARFDAFRRQAQSVRANDGLSMEDRERQVETLLLHAFPDDALRLRARTLNISGY